MCNISSCCFLDEVVIERGAELSTVGQVEAGEGPGNDKGGGAHSAAGGVGNNVAGTPKSLETASEPYGSIERPTTSGSQGGGPDGGLGGSRIYIHTDKLSLNGILNAGGGDSVTGGGGSGGSVYVLVEDTFEGLGQVKAEGGGTSSSEAGGGSGGRIGVYTHFDEFLGTYHAQGGYSPATYGYGGPGSVYIQSGAEIDNSIERKFIIENSNGQKHSYLTLNENSTDIVFENLYIENYAKFQVINDGIERTLDVKKVHGDGTGLIRIREMQRGTLERIASGNNTVSKLRVNLELHNGGEFIMSETCVLLGLADTALDLDGTLRGAFNLQVAEGRQLRMGANARIVPYFETNQSRQSSVTFGYFQLDPSSVCTFDPDVGANMIIGQFNVKYKSVIQGDYFNITASNMDVGQEAVLSSAGPDRRDSEAIDISLGEYKLLFMMLVKNNKQFRL